MDVRLDVMRTYVIDGKEYDSPGEMPESIRRTYEKAMARSSGARDSESRMAFKTKIVFNGVEYEGVDSMPGEVRKLCELVASAVGTGSTPPGAVDGTEHDLSRRIGTNDSRVATISRKPIGPGYSKRVVRRTLVGVLAILVLAAWLHYLLR